MYDPPLIGALPNGDHILNINARQYIKFLSYSSRYTHHSFTMLCTRLPSTMYASVCSVCWEGVLLYVLLWMVRISNGL